MGELDVRSNLKATVHEAVAKIAQQPDCWTSGVGSLVNWETKYVPFGAAAAGVAWDTTDFFVHFSSPVRGLFMSAGLGGIISPSIVGISFVPRGIALSALAVTTVPEPDLFALSVDKLLLFEEDIQDIYVTVGVPAGGPFTGAGYPNQFPISGARGFKAIYSLI